MKKIEAILRRERLDRVLDALALVGYPGVTVSDVRGHGKQKGVRRQWRGNEYCVKLLPKVKLELVILDEEVGRTIEAITRNGRTGGIGDGKIFVLGVEEAVRVRTGDSGARAV